MSKIEDITKKLETGVKEIFESDAYKKYLSFMAKFYNYSACNSMLIWMQKPDATLVAGYKAWQTKFNRQVKKGEKAIKIIAPCPHKKKIEKDGEEKEVSWTSYRAVNVFDISQTDGDEVPRYDVKELEGGVEMFDELKCRIWAISPSEIRFEDIDGSAKGYFNPSTNKIVIQEGMSEVQTIKVALHEIAHAFLHGKDGEETESSRNAKEVQAESIAFTVCSYLGIDTSDYSFAYVTGWSSDKNTRELTDSMEVIRKTAGMIIEKIA